MRDKTEALLAKLQERIAAAPPAKPRPQLRIVEVQPRPERFLDHTTRESHIKMIGHIRRRWGPAIQVIIDRACFDSGSIDALADAELVQLHRNMERASDCLREGITFEDAGLVPACFD